MHRSFRPTDLLLLFAPTFVGALSSLATIGAIPTWYRTLDKPRWTPPDRAFGPVWSALYLLMGVALVLVRATARTRQPAARPEPIATADASSAAPSSDAGPGAPLKADSLTPDDHSRVRLATRLFAVQLALNAAWSVIFFGRRAIRAAGVEILALWAVIAATIVAFWRVRPVAGLLLLPYLAWTTLATALNLEIWRRNR